MRWIYPLLLTGCVKQPMELARKHLGKSHNCLVGLRDTLHPLCKQLSYREITPTDILIRCHKADEGRGEFWDNYIFRISDPNIKYSAESQKVIDEHTICIDGGARIEAYAPDGKEIKITKE